MPEYTRLRTRPRILIVSQEGLYPDFVGGMEVRGGELRDALARIAHVTVLTRTQLVDTTAEPALALQTHPNLTGAPCTPGVELLQRISWRAGLVAAVHGARRAVRAHLTSVRPHLIYLNSVAQLSPPVVHALLTWGVPVVAWFGDRHSRLPALFGEEWRRQMAAELGNATHLVPNATMHMTRAPQNLHLVFNCDWLRAIYVPQFPAATPHSVLYDGVDGAHFAPAMQFAVPPHDPSGGTTDRTVRFVFLGRVVYDKGFIEFCEAMVSLDVLLRQRGGGAPRLEVEIIGDGDARAPGLEILHRAGMGPRITALGTATRDAVAKRLRRGSVMVSPSRDEALPASIMEAMASALPVIATDVGGTREVLEHGKNGLLVPVGDQEALVRACVSLATEHDLRCRLGANARARMLTAFRRDDGIEATVAIMQSALAPTPR
ncbi:MAG TPA: glycosyltransferase family 4 protein [Gemmatimonadaceae bacterium]|nr:glycosyltransferase family 4 protein [Gemmatimonadaceae bacterium]